MFEEVANCYGVSSGAQGQATAVASSFTDTQKKAAERRSNIDTPNIISAIHGNVRSPSMGEPFSKWIFFLSICRLHTCVPPLQHQVSDRVSQMIKVDSLSILPSEWFHTISRDLVNKNIILKWLSSNSSSPTNPS